MTAPSTSGLSESARQVIELVTALVGYPSVSETTNLELQGWLADRGAERGGTTHLFQGASGRANQLMRFGPAVDGGLLLAGHTDVVPAGDGWSSNPWHATVADAAVFGRGTADMKAFFACALVAIAQFDPSSLQAPVHVLASYDEEIGCVGIRDMLGTLPSLVNPALVVVGEPTSMRPRHSHLGKRTYRVVVRAPEAHSSRAARCPSAITQAARLVGALDRVLAQCPASSDEEIPYSLNVGTIAGGRQTNVIASMCEFVFEVRHDVDHHPDEVLAPFTREVEAVERLLADHGGTVSVDVLNQYPALRTDERIGAFAEAVRIADSGPASALGFGTEGGLIAGVIDAPVMVCGPGDIAVAHRPNEFVPINELERCVQFLRQLIEHFCVTHR